MFEVESFQKVLDVPASGVSESIEAVGNVEHIFGAERAHRASAWLQDYEMAYACITEQVESSSYQETFQSLDSSHWRVLWKRRWKLCIKTKLGNLNIKTKLGN
jgi:hypothetical protein